jgi:hypothetical protein
VTTQQLIYATLGVLSTAYAFYANRHLFSGRRPGRVSTLEALFYVCAVAGLALGWYFNTRYSHQFHNASYINYTKKLFDNPASASSAQDSIIVNVAILPLWTIVDGRRRGLRSPAVFFVMSLFTSLAFSVGMYLAFVERQLRYNAAEVDLSSTA